MSYFAQNYFPDEYFASPYFSTSSVYITVPELSDLIPGGNGSSFAEFAFAEIIELQIGAENIAPVIIHFNDSFLVFTLNINKEQDHDLSINKEIDFSLTR